MRISQSNKDPCRPSTVSSQPSGSILPNARKSDSNAGLEFKLPDATALGFNENRFKVDGDWNE